MNRIRFSPFRNKPAQESRMMRMDPIDRKFVVKELKTPKSKRSVTIVHPEQAAAYRLKAQLLSDGHQRVETFFLPESFLSMVEQGHQPHIVFVHDFIVADAGMTGVELARKLRTEHDFRGLIFSTSPDHAGVSEATLEIHGFSGHASRYLSK